MSFNGSGNFSLVAGNPVTTGTTISSTWANNTLSDIATGLTTAICKDGQSTPTANIGFGGFKLTNVGAGTALTDGARVGNVQNATGQQLGGVAGTNTITATGSPTVTAYASGQFFSFIAAGANTGATTLNIDTLGAKNVLYNNAACVGGEIASGAMVTVRYDGTSFHLVTNYAAATLPVVDSTAIVKNAGDATKLVKFSAASLTTATTRTITVPDVNGTLQVFANPAVRQTVISGPVDSGGLPNFGGGTGSTTVTASGTLIATFANGYSSSGASDFVGSITNPSWTGLSTNGTMYLYLDYTAGTVTTGSTTLAPTYQWGGTYSTTNNQYTYNIQEATMKVGNGASASVVTRVFVGEVTVAANVVSAITWYALMGRYDSGFTATLPGTSTSVSKNHNIGTNELRSFRMVLECTSNDASYVTGDRIEAVLTFTTSVFQSITPTWTRNALQIQTGANNAFVVTPKGGGSGTGLTAANWKYKLIAERNF